jgi:hypothetical protein
MTVKVYPKDTLVIRAVWRHLQIVRETPEGIQY